MLKCGLKQTQPWSWPKINPATVQFEGSYIEQDFVDMVLDLKNTYGNTLPRRATLAKLMKKWQDGDPETLQEEVLEVFREAQNNPKHINWNKY